MDTQWLALDRIVGRLPAAKRLPLQDTPLSHAIFACRHGNGHRPGYTVTAHGGSRAALTVCQDFPYTFFRFFLTCSGIHGEYLPWAIT